MNPHKSLTGPNKPSTKFVTLLMGLAIVLGAITVLRTLHASTEDGSPMEELAVGCVMAATSCGGAFLAEGFLRRLERSGQLTKERRTIQRRLRAARKRYEHARQWVEQRTRKQEKQLDGRTKDAADYAATHARIAARKPKKKARKETTS